MALAQKGTLLINRHSGLRVVRTPQPRQTLFQSILPTLDNIGSST